jgi:hypothetical protein
VELGEVEAAVRRLPDVVEAAVVARPDRAGHLRLSAYVVTGGPLSAGRLRGRLAELLPDHMVPALFVPLSELPLTPSGKVDRRALPDPGADAAGAADRTDPHAAPRDATEATLATIWADVLGLPAVGVRDNFFEHGGDSILAIQWCRGSAPPATR